MYNWQNYLRRSCRWSGSRTRPYQITEVVNNLQGVLPQAPTLNLTPEDWYFVK